MFWDGLELKTSTLFDQFAIIKRKIKAVWSRPTFLPLDLSIGLLFSAQYFTQQPSNIAQHWTMPRVVTILEKQLTETVIYWALRLLSTLDSATRWGSNQLELIWFDCLRAFVWSKVPNFPVRSTLKKLTFGHAKAARFIFGKIRQSEQFLWLCQIFHRSVTRL